MALTFLTACSMIRAMDLSIRIRDLRQARRLTQMELAYRAGISLRTLASLELDADHNPTTKTLEAVAGVLGVSLLDLLNGSAQATEAVA